MKYVLWTLQILLALVFLFAGGSKFLMSADEMTAQMTVKLPILFIRFIGTCEILGVLGLILPSALRIKPGLTPLAAAGLMIITLGATVVTVMGGQPIPALFPLGVATASGFVAYGRWKLLPIKSR